MKISIVIPIYNEASIIADTLQAANDYLAKNFSEYELIFSDDGSKDNCRATGEAVAKTHPNVRAVGYAENHGKGCAIRTGMLAATGDIILFTDCDLAYGLDVIATAAKMMSDNPDADMVIGSRNLTDDGYAGYTLLRKIASKTYIKCLAIAANFKHTDSQCGFKCFRKEMVQKIFPSCEVNGFAFDFEVLIKAKNLGAKVLEMPVKVINHRESKVHVLRDSIRMLRDIRKIKKRNKV